MGTNKGYMAIYILSHRAKSRCNNLFSTSLELTFFRHSELVSESHEMLNRIQHDEIKREYPCNKKYR